MSECFEVEWMNELVSESIWLSSFFFSGDVEVTDRALDRVSAVSMSNDLLIYCYFLHGRFVTSVR